MTTHRAHGLVYILPPAGSCRHSRQYGRHVCSRLDLGYALETLTLQLRWDKHTLQLHI